MFKTTYKYALMFLCASTITAMATTAFGQECETDDDCAEGDVCEITSAGSTGCPPCPPCEEGVECPPCECDESSESFSECVEDDSCTTDADCPTGLSCQFSDPSIACTVDSDGTEMCEESTPSTDGYCAFSPETCDSNADCPDNYECISSELNDCAEICGDEGCFEDCEPSGETEPGYCYPEEISCTADLDCPSEWTCLDVGNSNDCGATDCACPECPEGGDCPPCDCGEPEESCEEVASEMLCIPDEFVGLVERENADDNSQTTATGGTANNSPNAESGAVDNAPEANTDESSCTVTPSHTPKAPGVLAILTLFAMFTFLRRRA